ncbi:MAG: nuclear transport factor 2 family protein [Deltaproteobacteria bacterium]|nr:nuclear transport factor 2 family protein [Deltaproteobacteria bacterium]
MTHPNAQLITRFYESFSQRDAEGMAACYHPDVVFSDPAFQSLRGAEAGDMWRMLVSRGKDLTVEFRDVSADDNVGSAHWDARYTFGATGKKVLNQIDARFEFRDGLIVRHTDSFDFAVWSRQALGLVGLLFGRTSWLERKVRRGAGEQLAAYRAKHRKA